LGGFLERPRQRKVDTRCGAHNVRKIYSIGSLKTVTSELAMYNLNLVTVREIIWVEDGSQPADDYIFLYGIWNVNHHLRSSFFVYK